MNEKKIKVVKKADADAVRSAKRRSRKKQPSAARQMITNVTSWVTDVKVPNASDARAAFDGLFLNNPEPSEG